MPHKSNVAKMLREDTEAARDAWLAEVERSPQKYAERNESDFLMYRNDVGKVADFHALRHTCGAWLALTGARPKVIQRS